MSKQFKQDVLPLFENKHLSLSFKSSRAARNIDPVIYKLTGYGMLLGIILVAGAIYSGILAILPADVNSFIQGDDGKNVWAWVLFLIIGVGVFMLSLPWMKRFEERVEERRYQAKRTDEKRLQDVLRENGYIVPAGYGVAEIYSAPFEDVETGVVYHAYSASYNGNEVDIYLSVR